MPRTDPGPRRTQAERRATSRSAILESAARGLTRHGYAGLSLDRVAREAGYSRGALYHQFADKEALALAVVTWIDETWNADVGHLLALEGDPVETLFEVARAHAAYCRRDVARTMRVLAVEFPDPTHPIGAAHQAVVHRLLHRVTELVAAAQSERRIPADPPAADIALAVISALESTVAGLSGREPSDAVLAERAVRGLLGLDAGA